MLVICYLPVLLKRMSLWSLKGNVKCCFLEEKCFSCSLGVVRISHFRGKKKKKEFVQAVFYLFRKDVLQFPVYKPLHISQAGHRQYMESQPQIIVSYFTSKMSLFRNSREVQFGTSKLWRTTGNPEGTKERLAYVRL